MNRLQFFKTVGGLVAALLVKPKPVMSADDVVIAPVTGFSWNDPPLVSGSGITGRITIGDGVLILPDDVAKKLWADWHELSERGAVVVLPKN